MGLYIHDAQLASLFHHDPILRHNAIQLSVAASDELFSAPSATQWAQLMRKSSVPQTTIQQHLHFSQLQSIQQHPLAVEINCRHSKLTCYVILHGIEAAVEEASQICCVSADQQTFSRFRDALMCWYHAYGPISSASDPDTFCLIILWHKIFMSILVDFNALECAIGRDGSSDASSAQSYASQWASSIEAKRCIIHASLISCQMGAMRVDAEPAIHVPRCMFLAAIVWYCYIKFGTMDISIPAAGEEDLDFLEIRVLGVNPVQHLCNADGFKKGKLSVIEAGPLCRLTDMLHKIGHWDIARRFARILGLLLHENTDSHLVE